MSKENARRFLSEGFGDSRVVEFLQARDYPKTEEEELGAYVDIAAAIGLDLTADELRAAIEEAGRERLAKTEEDIASVRVLSDEELAQVAGGVVDYHEYCESNYWDEDRCCKDTYKDLENCWHNDACDIVYHDYWDYRCKRAHFCSGGYNGA